MGTNYSRRRQSGRFCGPLALALAEAVPGATDPVDAILRHAQFLLIESGISEPPFDPRAYARLRNVVSIAERELRVDGRLLPLGGEFIIELRRDRSPERKNFTCAHELGHTFFYESVPSIKYRRSRSPAPAFDQEEEKLCNIAAAELLMPTDAFRKLANDFLPSTSSLLRIAKIFVASLTATAIRVCSLTRWDATFILWTRHEDGVQAKWIVRPREGFRYLPSIEPIDPKSSGIYHTVNTREPTTTREFLLTNQGVRPCRVESVFLTNECVLSCITSSGPQGSSNSNVRSTKQTLLPLDYRCGCYGTGWTQTVVDGRLTARRCLAVRHVTSGN